MTDERPKIDRSYYNSPEFKEKLKRSTDAALNDPVYQQDIAAWNGSPDELKAELAQLAAENRRLWESLIRLTPEEAVSQAQDLIDDNAERFPKSHKPGSVRFYDEFGHADLYSIDFIKAKETLQTPPTPGLGAAMVRVVEAAKVCATEYRYPELKAAMEKLEEAVQALNELEAENARLTRALEAIMETTAGKPIGSTAYNVHIYAYGVLKRE